MRFADPSHLWLLLALPVGWYLLSLELKFRNRFLQRFASAAALAKAGVPLKDPRRLFRAVLLFLAVACILVSIPRPQWGYEDRKIVTRGADIIIAVDTSTSMLTADYQPNRLTRAKELLQNLVWESKGDRVGIMAFAGSAVMVCPLTIDHAMVDTALANLGPASVPSQGTRIANAIDTANRAFENASVGEKILVLLTDGENHDDDPAKAIDAAAKGKVKIFTIGIGTSEGSPIPTADGGFKQDKEGKVITSRLDFETLKKVAHATGGEAIKANPSGFAELDVIRNALGKTRGQNQKEQVFRVYTERFPWFLGLAVALLIVEMFAGVWRSRSTRSGAAAILGPVLLLLCCPQQAMAWPGESQKLSQDAWLEFKRGNFTKAMELYSKAQSVDKANPITNFNLGTAKAKAGKADEAKETLKQVFDPANPALNAAAQFNQATLDQQKLQEELQEKSKAWEKEKDPAKIKTEVDKAIEDLSNVQGQYRQAMTSHADRDAAHNYEVVERELEKLRKLQEQMSQPEQQKQDQQQQEQQQDNMKKDPKGDRRGKENQPQDSKDNNNQDKQDGQKNQDQKQDPEKNKDQQSKDSDKQEQKSDPDKQKDQQEQGKENPENSESDNNGDQEKKEQEKGKGPKPTPTPSPKGTPEPGKEPKDGKSGDDEAAEMEDVPPGQMSQADVDRLLNSLPPENSEALQKFYNPNYRQSSRDMEKDW